MIYGYARVSTKEQNTDRQLIALENYGIAPENILTDKQSGKDFERVNYKKVVRKLRKGDVLVVKSIDRLGRNYKEIIEQWQHITQKKKADIVVLDMPLLDTTRSKDLLGTFISDIVLQLLSFVAENERTNIRQRQAEGIAAAKEKGVQFGRPLNYSAETYIAIYKKCEKGTLTKDQAIKKIGCCRSTFYRMYKDLRASGKL